MSMEECTSHNKSHIQETTGSITVKGEKLRAFPLRSGTRQECSLLSLLFYIVLEILATALRQENEINVIQMEKKKNDHYLQITYIILKNPQDFFSPKISIN